MNGVKLSETDLGVMVSKNLKTSAVFSNSKMGKLKKQNGKMLLGYYKARRSRKLEYSVQAQCSFLKKDIEVLQKFQKRANKLSEG